MTIPLLSLFDPHSSIQYLKSIIPPSHNSLPRRSRPTAETSWHPNFNKWILSGRRSFRRIITSEHSFCHCHITLFPWCGILFILLYHHLFLASLGGYTKWDNRAVKKFWEIGVGKELFLIYAFRLAFLPLVLLQLTFFWSDVRSRGQSGWPILYRMLWHCLYFISPSRI